MSMRAGPVGDVVVPRWVRWGVLVVLAVPQLVTGLWAVLAPRHFFDEFPGVGPLLVAAEPPFNRHLATDAGGAFLATGVALLIATVWPRRELVMMAIVTYLAFAVPHAVYHATHDAPGLSSGEDVVNMLMLVGAAAAAGVLLWGAWSSGARQLGAEGVDEPNERTAGTAVSSMPNSSR